MLENTQKHVKKAKRKFFINNSFENKILLYTTYSNFIEQIENNWKLKKSYALKFESRLHEIRLFKNKQKTKLKIEKKSKKFGKNMAMSNISRAKMSGKLIREPR